MEDLQTINHECFVYLNHVFATAVKLIGN